jgi:predicted Fe-Mo cluster-binding NifX family protein
MKVAIPSAGQGGLEAPLSAHFGHCDAFTLVDFEEGQMNQVEVMPNVPHSQGGCMAPVQALKQAGVDVLMAGGMGARPLAGFQQVGIRVFYTENATTVQAAVDMLNSGGAREFGPAQVCGGGEGHCGSH